MVVGTMTESKKGMIIYPTDTVWGIGASIFDDSSNRKIRVVKNNDHVKPLSILFHNVSQFETFISLPEGFTFDLNSLFKMGVTLLVPTSWIIKKISSEVFMDSLYVGARVASNELEDRLSQVIQDPITTTSLNLTTEKPILTEPDALAFQKKYAEEADFITSLQIPPSGEPSTIIKVEENLELHIVRAGKNSAEIEKYLGL
jgi:L-threonylcarbamoyladenylate synthase